MGADPLRFVRAGIGVLHAGLALVVIAATVPYTFLQMFTQFQVYDDEGYIMSSVKTFLGGQALYDRTFTQYGPFYYLVAGLFYRVSGLPVGHDVTRIVTIVLWVLAAVLLGAFVYRVTGSFALALATYLQAVLFCTGLIGEPGHPQGLLLVLVAILLLAATLARVEAVPIGLGIVTACLILTKINVGVFAAGACVMAIVAVTPRRGLLLAAAGAAFSALPFVLMRTGLSGPTLIYALTASATIAACSIASVRLPEDAPGGVRALGRFAVAVSATSLVIAGCTLALGTSLAGLFEGVVAAPLRFGDVYGQVWALPAAAAWYGGVSIALALVVVLLPEKPRAAAMTVLKLAFAALMLRAMPHGAIAAATLAPFVWIVLLPAAPRAASASFVAALVAFVAAAQLLVAYPVAGNQQAWATLWLLPAAAVAAAEGAASLWRGRGWLPRLADAVLVAGVLYWFYPAYDTTAVQERYRVYAPLDLPHAEMIRLPRAQKRAYHQLVDAVRANCDALVTMPGLESFHFWTRMPPLTGFNATAWMTLLDAPAQQRIVDALAAHPSACVIYHDGLMHAWVGAHDVSQRPLVRYIGANFHAARTIGDYQLLVRNGRELPR